MLTLDSKYCASGSLDTNVYIWSVDKPVRTLPLKNVGFGGVNGALWIGDGKLGVAGADGAVRVFEVGLQ